MGGLSRKAFQIKTITEKDKLPVLVLDAGNLLFKPQSLPNPQDKVTAAGIMTIYTAMSYDAVAVGPQDTVGGLDLLVEAQKNGFPWLSANILDAGHKPVFKPATVITRAGLAIGIIGLSDPATRVPAQSTVADWREILPGQLAILEKTCDLLILLSTLPGQDNVEISKTYPQLDIILTADRQQGNITPRVVNNTLVAQTSRQGKYLGVLTIDWNPDRPWIKDLQQENQLLQNRLDILDRQILRLERRKTVAGTPTADLLPQLRKEREVLLDRITGMKAEMAGPALDDSFSTFTHSFVALSRNLPEDPAIADQVNRIKGMTNR
jgi:2',3'-cyclic-nucleotide 2'-phosphodiesterase (5'-nucleotidase family)